MMKKLGIFLFFLLFILAGIYAIFQSSFVKNFLKNAISDAFFSLGYQVHIEHIEGALPSRIELKGVTIEGQDLKLSIQDITLKPVLWRLIKKELAFQGVVAKKVSLSDEKPFDFSGNLRLSTKQFYARGALEGWNIFLRYHIAKKEAHFSGSKDSFNIRGRASFKEPFELISSSIQLNDDLILTSLPFNASGRLMGNIKIKKEQEEFQGEFICQVADYQVGLHAYEPLKAEGVFTVKDRNLRGKVSGPFSKVDFDLTLLSDFLVSGHIDAQVENIQAFHIPDFYGKIEVKAFLEEENGVQAVLIEPLFSDFSYHSYTIERVFGFWKILDPFRRSQNSLNMTISRGSFSDLTLEHCTLKAEQNETEWPFSMSAKGTWFHPFEWTSLGTFSHPFAVDLQLFSGRVLNLPLVLEHATHIAWSQEALILSKTEGSLDQGTLLFSITRRGSNTEAHLSGKNLPLDILSMNPLDDAILGAIDIEVIVKEQNNRLSGTLSANIEQVEPFVSLGKVEAGLSEDLLTLKGKFSSRNGPICTFDASLPIHFSIWPFHQEVLYTKAADGHLTYQGRIERFRDYWNIGPHRLEGGLKADILFKNSLVRPEIAGLIQIQNGSYENYYTGTQLGSIQAEFVANKQGFYLNNLSAQDPNQGTFEATGHIDLLLQEHFPFLLDCKLVNFQFVTVDLVQAIANGEVQIKGNALKAMVKGDVTVSDTTLTIPSHIAKPLPDLNVTYRHPIREIVLSPKDYEPYPLLLDLNISAPRVNISGRGLESEWKGDFHLGGSFTSIATHGKLTLIEGQFNFSSRSFKLTEGALSFSGKEYQMPHLKLAGTTETKGILITAKLSGPLDNPQVTLQSNPSLPLSSILSYLLFGQDLSEIGGFQALQIATSLASLAGTGPDIMESTRKSL